MQEQSRKKEIGEANTYEQQTSKKNFRGWPW
jgi:hypothetical protein